MVSFALQSRSAFAGILHDYGIAAQGVVVTDRSGVGLANVLAGQTNAAYLEAAVQNAFGLALPTGPRRSGTDELAFVGVGPGRYLAVGDTSEVAAKLSGLASVFDQTDGYGVLRLSGPKVRETLAKGVGIDLHPAVFAVGDAATTSVAHIGVNLWRLADAADGSAVFEIAMFRSMAGSFWHFLSLSAAEFGLVVRPATA